MFHTHGHVVFAFSENSLIRTKLNFKLNEIPIPSLSITKRVFCGLQGHSCEAILLLKPTVLSRI